MRFTVHLHPGSKQEKIVKTSDEFFEAWVRAKPKDNEANIQLVKLLAEYFHIPKTCVEITHGHHSRIKVINVTIL